MADEKIIGRVRALLTQAADNGATDEESQTYYAKAAELMDRHNLDAAIFRQEQGEEPARVERWDFWVSGKGGHGKARVLALGVICRAFGCQSAVRGNTAASSDRMMMIIGTTDALESLKILLPALSLQIENSATKAARARIAELDADYWTAGERARIRRTTFRSYIKGWGHGAAAKITKSREDIAEEVAGTGAELVLLTDRERVTAAFTTAFPKLAKYRPERNFSATAYHAGVDAGSRADIGGGNLSSDSRRQLK